MTKTSSSQRIIELVSIEDYDQVEQLMDRANEYARQRSGDYLWHYLDFVRSLMRHNILNGQLYAIRNDEREITSTIAIIEEDKRIWGEIGVDGQALYLEKLMKNPQKAEPDEAKQLMVFAAKEAIRRGRPYLRCDTVSSQEGLVRYYQRLGFRDRGHFTYTPSNKPGILLEITARELIKNLNT